MGKTLFMGIYFGEMGPNGVHAYGQKCGRGRGHLQPPAPEG